MNASKPVFVQDCRLGGGTAFHGLSGFGLWVRDSEAVTVVNSLVLGGLEQDSSPHTALAVSDSLVLLVGTQVLAATDRVDGAARGIEVTIAGLKSYRQLDYLLYYFETDVEGMTQVYLRDFTNTVATVRLEYDGTTQALARKVARESFKGFRLEPTEVTGNQLQFSVIGSR